MEELIVLLHKAKKLAESEAGRVADLEDATMPAHRAATAAEIRERLPAMRSKTVRRVLEALADVLGDNTNTALYDLDNTMHREGF